MQGILLSYTALRRGGKWIGSLILGGILAGCSLFQTTAVTPGVDTTPSSDVLVSTPSLTPFQPLYPTATLTPSPTSTPTPLPPSCPGGSCLATSAPSPVVEASPSATAPAVGQIPASAVRIIQPGPLSKVISPINLEANAILGSSGVVRIELLGEDGRYLNREVLHYGPYPGQRVYLASQITFELPTVSEAARLQIVVESENGQVQSLSSVDLVLLKMGEAEINQAASALEPLVISSPASNQIFSGGKLAVSVLVNDAEDQPILIDLIADQGNIVGSRQVKMGGSDDHGYGAFQAEVPYTISEPTWARVLVHQAGGRMSGDAIARSVRVLLKP